MEIIIVIIWFFFFFLNQKEKKNSPRKHVFGDLQICKIRPDIKFEPGQIWLKTFRSVSVSTLIQPEIIWQLLDGSLTPVSWGKVLFCCPSPNGCIRRTGYRIEAGAPCVPVKAAQWCMKPKKLYDQDVEVPGCVALLLHDWAHRAEKTTSGLVLGIKWFNHVALLDFPNVIWPNRSNPDSGKTHIVGAVMLKTYISTDLQTSLS